MNRIEIIKAAQEKINRRQTLVNKIKRSNRNAIGYSYLESVVEDKKFFQELDALDENYNQIDPKTARAIAEIEVGETYRETLKYDNEWN